MLLVSALCVVTIRRNFPNARRPSRRLVQTDGRQGLWRKPVMGPGLVREHRGRKERLPRENHATVDASARHLPHVATGRLQSVCSAADGANVWQGRPLLAGLLTRSFVRWRMAASGGWEAGAGAHVDLESPRPPN